MDNVTKHKLFRSFDGVIRASAYSIAFVSRTNDWDMNLLH